MATQPKIPPYHKLMWPTLQALKDLGGSGTNREIADRVIEIERFTEEHQAVMQKGRAHR
jgi:restriction system protein